MSERQGKVLDVLVKKYPNISVFSINYHYRDDPALETVKLHHNVTKAPTLIINGNLSFTDFVSLEDLESLLAYS